MYYFPMLQHPIRAILIRVAMEVLALRLEKNTSALAAVITKEQTCSSGYHYVSAYVCRNYHINCVLLCIM